LRKYRGEGTRCRGCPEPLSLVGRKKEGRIMECAKKVSQEIRENAPDRSHSVLSSKRGNGRYLEKEPFGCRKLNLGMCIEEKYASMGGAIEK